MLEYELLNISELSDAKLLSMKQYEDYEIYIPTFRDTWWLMPDRNDECYSLCFVKNGTPYYKQYDFNHLSANIYPLIISESNIFRPGKIYIDNNDDLYKGLSYTEAIKMNSIGETLFNSNATDLDSCSKYNNSDVCNIINSWFNTLFN